MVAVMDGGGGAEGRASPMVVWSGSFITQHLLMTCGMFGMGYVSLIITQGNINVFFLVET